MTMRPMTHRELRVKAKLYPLDMITVVDFETGIMYLDAITDYDEEYDEILIILDDEKGGHKRLADYGETWTAYDLKI